SPGAVVRPHRRDSALLARQRVDVDGVRALRAGSVVQDRATPRPLILAVPVGATPDSRFCERIARCPPKDAPWPWHATRTRAASDPMNLTTTYLGFALTHPLMPGASPMVDDTDMVRRLEDAGASAIVMHSLFEEQLAAREHGTGSQAGHANSFGEAL